jgi:hypothetical protein
VACLAVGVVDGDVEQDDRVQGLRSGGHDVEGRPVEVVGDEGLHGPRPVRPVAQDRRWHEPPAGRLAHEKGGHLAAAQRAGREVPQGGLTALGLVDDQDGLAARLQPGKERVVRRRREQAEQLQVARLELGGSDQRISVRP